MTGRDGEGLRARIAQLRRLAATPDGPVGDSGDPRTERVRSLERRVAHLEQMVEGLQDSVHRESERHARLIAELQAQIQPGSIGAALADDARNRGL